MVIGIGGKRPQMAAIAARLSDRVVVTSDNPRTEDPQQILDDVVAGIPADSDLLVEGDRAKAIASAIAEAEPNDLVLVAVRGTRTTRFSAPKRCISMIARRRNAPCV